MGTASSLAQSPIPTNGLRAWFRADAGIVASGGVTVASWEDQSGNHLTVEQPGGSQLQPTILKRAINNQDALRFDGGDSLQTSGSSNLLLSLPNASIFVVAVPAGPSQSESAKIIDFDSGAPGGWGIEQGTSTNKYRFIFNNNGKIQGEDAEAQLRSYRAQIFSVIKSSSSQRLFVNQAQVASTLVNPSIPVGTNFLALGGGVNNPSTRWKGDLAEVIIYNRALTDAEKQQVTDYLDTKYGIVPALPIPKQGLRAWFRTDIGVQNSPYGTVAWWTDYISGITAIGVGGLDVRPTLIDDGRGGSTIRFDGINDKLKTSPVDLLGGGNDLSVFVVAHPATASQPALACIVDHTLNAGGNSDHGFAVEQDSVIGNKFCLDWLDPSGGQLAASAKVTVAADEMHIFTAVKSGTQQVVSVNSGTENLTASVSNLSPDMLSGTNVLAIGGSVTDPGKQFSGDVSAIIIYNRALSVDDQQTVQNYLSETYSLHGTKFQFVLEGSSTTSAGVYTADDRLIRTLWRKVTLGPGAITRTWDGKNDDGGSVSPGAYRIKVISHDVQYVWDGVIGNTSTSIVGPSHHGGQTFIHSLAVDDEHSKAFYALGEAEGFAPVRRFDTGSPQTAINVLPADAKVGIDHVATDGIRVYYSNKGAPSYFAHPAFVAASKVSDNSSYDFNDEHHTNYAQLVGCPNSGEPYYPSCIDVVPTPTPVPGCSPLPPPTCTPPPAPCSPTPVPTPSKGATGLAVQKTGIILAVSHGTLNEIRLFDKETGEPKGTIAVTNPGELAMTPAGDLWVLSGTTAKHYTDLEHTPTLLPPGITGLTAPAGITIRPLAGLVGGIIGIGETEGSGEQVEVIIADGGSAQVLKSFDMDGTPRWVYPEIAGGYATRGPDVTNDKFLFQVGARGSPVIRTGLSAADGTIWVGEGATSRLLRLGVDNQGHASLLDQIMFLVYNENGDADPTHPTRVIGDGWLEFEVDYTKGLQQSGSWTLKKNWAAGLPSYFFAFGGGNDEGMHEVTTLSNGRVYATITDYRIQADGSKGKTVVELTRPGENPPVDNLRICKDASGQNLVLANRPTAGAYGLPISQPPTFERDGSQRYVRIAGGVVTWYQKNLIGFDASRNPQWESDENERFLASAPYRNEDPVVFDEKGWRQNRNPITSSGVIVTFDDTFRYNGEHTKTTFPSPTPIEWAHWKHLGGVALTRTDWSWKSSPTVLTDVPFDGLGSFDVEDNINYAASLAMVQGRNVIYSYHGENWNTGEASQWMHFYDNGLFIGQFGTSTDVRHRWGEAIPGFTGNSLFPSMVGVNGNNQFDVDGETYLWTDDKSLHSGVARWHILGANSVREFSGSVALGGFVDLTTPTPQAPPNLVASPGNGQVTLTWLPIMDRSELPPMQLNYTYHVKYSTSNGGPYTTAGSTTGTTFTVSSLSNETKYYFVVSAENSPVNSKQVAAFPFATVGKAGHMTGGYLYPLQVTSGATGRNVLTGLPTLLGDLTRTDIGHIGYVIYNWADAGTLQTPTPVPFTTRQSLPGTVSVGVAPGSWVNVEHNVLNRFMIDGTLGLDSSIDLPSNTTGSIAITVADGATHYLTVFSPPILGNKRDFTIGITPLGQSFPSASYVISDPQGAGDNHIFQFSFVGNITLTVVNRNADKNAGVQALFLD